MPSGGQSVFIDEDTLMALVGDGLESCGFGRKS